MRLADPVEGHQLGQRAVGVQWLGLALHQVGVRARAPAHRLGGVVDQDVQRPGGGDIIGERDDLGGIAKVDPHDLEPVDPLWAVGQLGEPADGVAGEAGRHRQVRAIAQQHQGDVHADLGATPGEQRAASGEVGVLVALGVRHGRTVRTEPVVERVHQGVVGMADVAPPRRAQLAGIRALGGGHQGDAARLVIDAHRRPRGGAGEHCGVGLLLREAGLRATGLADLAVHAPGRLLDQVDVGVARGQGGELVQDPQGGREVDRVDPAGLFIHRMRVRAGHPFARIGAAVDAGVR